MGAVVTTTFVDTAPFVRIGVSGMFLCSLLLEVVSDVVFSVFLVSTLVGSETYFGSFSVLRGGTTSYGLKGFSFV